MPAKVRAFFIRRLRLPSVAKWIDIRITARQEHAVDRYFKLAESFGAALRDLRFAIPTGDQPPRFDAFPGFVVLHPYSRGRNKSIGANVILEFCRALAPARVAKVFSDPEAKTIQAVVDEDQLSLAIGRKGQNVRLASQLTGWRLDLRGEAEVVRAQRALDDDARRGDVGNGAVYLRPGHPA